MGVVVILGFVDTRGIDVACGARSMVGLLSFKIDDKNLAKGPWCRTLDEEDKTRDQDGIFNALFLLPVLSSLFLHCHGA